MPLLLEKAVLFERDTIFLFLYSFVLCYDPNFCGFGVWTTFCLLICPLIVITFSFRYYYKFIIGGQWRHSTSLPTETDERGNVNNVIRVGDIARIRSSVPAQQQIKVSFFFLSWVCFPTKDFAKASQCSENSENIFFFFWVFNLSCWKARNIIDLYEVINSVQ